MYIIVLLASTRSSISRFFQITMIPLFSSTYVYIQFIVIRKNIHSFALLTKLTLTTDIVLHANMIYGILYVKRDHPSQFGFF